MSFYIGREASKVRFLLQVYNSFFYFLNFFVLLLAMEEDLYGDWNRNQSSFGEVEVYSWRFDISGSY